MKSLMIALAAATSVAAALPYPVAAYCRDCGVAAGVVAGAAAGAILGSAIAGPPRSYEDPAAYDAVPSADYVPPPWGYGPEQPPVDYIDGASCHIERVQAWNGNTYRWRNVQICE